MHEKKQNGFIIDSYDTQQTSFRAVNDSLSSMVNILSSFFPSDDRIIDGYIGSCDNMNN